MLRTDWKWFLDQPSWRAASETLVLPDITSSTFWKRASSSGGGIGAFVYLDFFMRLPPVGALADELPLPCQGVAAPVGVGGEGLSGWDGVGLVDAGEGAGPLGVEEGAVFFLPRPEVSTPGFTTLRVRKSSLSVRRFSASNFFTRALSRSTSFSRLGPCSSASDSSDVTESACSMASSALSSSR